MLRADREAEDCFVFLASPVASGSFGLRIYPEIPEVSSQVEVSKGRLRSFLFRHRREIAVEQISGTDDLFVSAMTKDEVRELTDELTVARRCASRV
jgi:hypothetical protein